MRVKVTMKNAEAKVTVGNVRAALSKLGHRASGKSLVLTESTCTCFDFDIFASLLR
jgi:hypothetical protein